MTPQEKEKRLANLRGHLATVGKKIKENVALLMDSDIIPVKSLNDITDQQEKLVRTITYLNQLGQTVFGPDWVPAPPSKIVDMNGYDHQLPTE